MRQNAQPLFLTVSDIGLVTKAAYSEASLEVFGNALLPPYDIV